MTPDELLQRAVRDLRDRTDGLVDFPRLTRQRVLATTVLRRQRRTRVVGACATLLILLVVSTVWATATGRLLGVWRRVDPPGPPATPRAAPLGSVRSSAALDTAHGSAASVATAPPPRLESPALRRPSPSRSRGAEERDWEDELFRAAYREHFVAHDPESALHGWDAYLRAAPHGPLALEAEYNRAVCLVRLGRRDEAIVALTPFAEGARGKYREHEARELVDALSARTGE